MDINHPLHNIGSLSRELGILMLHFSLGLVTLLQAHHVFHALLVVVRHELQVDLLAWLEVQDRRRHAGRLRDVQQGRLLGADGLAASDVRGSLRFVVEAEGAGLEHDVVAGLLFD